MGADGLGPPGPVLLRGLGRDALDGAWRRYERHRASSVRDEIGACYLSLVRFAVRRVNLGLPAVGLEDHLYSVGKAGLITAIEAFDLGGQQPFETFALAEIHSSLIGELSKTGELPYSRFWLRAKVGESLTARLGRAPTSVEREAEMAAWRSLPPKIMALPLPNATIAALDSLWTVSDADVERVSLLDSFPDGHAYLLHRDGPPGHVLDWLTALANQSSPGAHSDKDPTAPRDWIGEAMRELDDSDRLLVWLYFYENMRVLDIGGLVMLASGAIPRITYRAVLRLRDKLARLPGSLWHFADDPAG